MCFVESYNLFAFIWGIVNLVILFCKKRTNATKNNSRASWLFICISSVTFISFMFFKCKMYYRFMTIIQKHTCPLVPGHIIFLKPCYVLKIQDQLTKLYKKYNVLNMCITRFLGETGVSIPIWWWSLTN